ncbi:hypothetical protein [Paracraurococcus lichenis]|uniref:DUF4136 domain-containing protein n=1 Tax=Paracraurococcus lichenis TaxID=3064888 RepID=A0ABT9E5J8_9PROT|nr:hypothetical protein [Paracraurococcus sp. LOR1-02]MDO9711406.1 hypothetical protein [Paracraurococcus sp. LOR1-02]
MPSTLSRRAVLALALLLPGLAVAQPEPEPAAARFLEIVPTGGHGPVRLAVSQVTRVGRAEGYTVIDTTAYVQQRTVEAPDSVVRRVAAAGQRLVALTDPSGQRTWVAPDRVVLVRESEARHAAGARAAIVLVGLRFGQDVAVRETVDEVMAALGR